MRNGLPFVRLALARYQAGSIPGKELSPVVLADFAPLAAGRTASFWRDPRAPADVEITVTGPRAGQGNRLQAGIEVFDPQLAPALAAPLNDRSVAPPQDVAWLPVPDTFVDLVGAFSTVSPGLGDGHGAAVVSAMWQGAMIIPAHAPSQRVRVVVREYEPRRGDPLDVEGPAHVERLAYADAHELPTSTLLPR